ncbi:UNVERIFIED_CONTAM: hypothetical protein K2H54_004507 [Gekko kuhli]
MVYSNMWFTARGGQNSECPGGGGFLPTCSSNGKQISGFFTGEKKAEILGAKLPVGQGWASFWPGGGSIRGSLPTLMGFNGSPARWAETPPTCPPPALNSP